MNIRTRHDDLPKALGFLGPLIQSKKTQTTLFLIRTQSGHHWLRVPSELP
jgi:hypothetical protein